MRAWAGLSEKVDDLVARLRPIGKTIGEAAKNGDPLAQKIVNGYSMLAARVDPVAWNYTNEALKEWESR